MQYIKLEKTAPGEVQMRSFISTRAKDLLQYPRAIKNDSVDVNWDIAGHILMCEGKVRQTSKDTVKWVEMSHKKTVELIDGHYHFTDNEDLTVYSFNKKKIYSSGKDNEDSDLLVKKHKDSYFFCSKEENDSLWRINILEPTKTGFLYYYIASGDYFNENIDRYRQLGKFDQQGERNYIADLSDDAFYQLIADKQIRESLYFYQIEKKRISAAYCSFCSGRGAFRCVSSSVEEETRR
ncbi:MAG: hypothetical protein IPN33_18175 [Saprospiraceae bacterium]|nr:hypothetical protein [Saprospiraceae bacterium]